MNVIVIGCGYVAELYLASLANHPDLVVTGAYDEDVGRLEQFCRRHHLRAHRTLDDALADSGAPLVVNLTNPRSHFAVNRRALEAGKHVYSEKPLAMTLEDARSLVELAERSGLVLASAPCTLLGEAAQTMWRALRRGRIGPPRLVFAELSDGPIALMKPDTWKNDAGVPWPVQDEFEVGCTLEHAGYFVTWLTAFFGPVQRVSSFAHTVLADKGLPLRTQAPDLVIGVLEFRSGVIARLTCDTFASHDHRLRIFGDAGVLGVDEGWDMAAPVQFCPRTPEHLQNGLLMERFPPPKWLPWFRPQKVRPVRPPKFRYGGSRGAARIDFMRGVQEVASAVREYRPSRLGGRWALHVLEVVLGLAHGDTAAVRTIDSDFIAPEPMPWARD